MKNILLIFSLLHVWSLLLAQTNFIELSENRLSGYIFKKDYQPSFIINSADDRFTPHLADIVLAEGLLNSFDLLSRKSKKANRRQYLGFISGNMKYVLIHTMYYKCEKQFNKDYPNWNESFAYLFSEPNEMQKSHLYIINLNDQTIGYFANP